MLINNFHFHIMFRVLANPSVSFERATDMEASQQFWMSEDLLEHLLPMLDLPTMSNFASVNPLAVSVLSRPSMWRHFLERTYQPYKWPTECQHKENHRAICKNCEDGEIISAQQKALMVVELLKMMKDHELRFLELLDRICEAFPVQDDKESLDNKGEIKLNLGDSSRIISPTGFIFLGPLVSHVGSKVVDVEKVILPNRDEEWFAATEALMSHISRQEAGVDSIWLSAVDESTNSEELLSALGKCSVWGIRSLGRINESTWRKWAEVATRGEIQFLIVDGTELGCPETVRKVWLATEDISIDVEDLPASDATYGGYVNISGEEGEKGWTRILEIIAEKDQIESRKRKRDINE